MIQNRINSAFLDSGNSSYMNYSTRMRICLHFALSCLSCRTKLTPSHPYTHSPSPQRQPCRWWQCLAGSPLWRGSSLAVPQPRACPTSATFPHRELAFKECPRIIEGRAQSPPGLLHHGLGADTLLHGDGLLLEGWVPGVGNRPWGGSIICETPGLLQEM